MGKTKRTWRFIRWVDGDLHMNVDELSRQQRIRGNMNWPDTINAVASELEEEARLLRATLGSGSFRVKRV